MAFLKNRISVYLIYGLISLAVIGVTASLISNPAGFLKRIAVILFIGAVIFFLFRRISRAGSNKSEQRAFIHAAKKSKKRYLQKDSTKISNRKTSGSSLTSIKKPRKKSSANLTVIQGKKGKKKDRATL